VFEAHHVRQDPALGIATVFRVLAHRKQRPKLDVRQEFGGLELRWRGPDALGPPEETLLYSILDIAKWAPRLLDADSTTHLGKRLRRGLQPRGIFHDAEVVVIETSFCELARHCGYDTGGAALRQVKAMLQRMVEVTLWTRHATSEGSSRLLYWLVAENDSVQLAINLRLSAAVLGDSYVNVCLAERRALTSQVAKTLHARLSAQLRPGCCWTFSLSALELRVWGESAQGSTRRTRHSQLRNALTQIDALDHWDASQMLSMFKITHLKTPGKAPTPRKSTDISPEKRRQPAAPEAAPALEKEAIDGSLVILQTRSGTDSPKLLGRAETTPPRGVENGAAAD
jgi:hypothetical protein